MDNYKTTSFKVINEKNLFAENKKGIFADFGNTKDGEKTKIYIRNGVNTKGVDLNLDNAQFIEKEFETSDSKSTTVESPNTGVRKYSIIGFLLAAFTAIFMRMKFRKKKII